MNYISKTIAQCMWLDKTFILRRFTCCSQRGKCCVSDFSLPFFILALPALQHLKNLRIRYGVNLGNRQTPLCCTLLFLLFYSVGQDLWSVFCLTIQQIGRLCRFFWGFLLRSFLRFGRLSKTLFKLDFLLATLLWIKDLSQTHKWLRFLR